MKKCASCKDPKSLNDFRRDKRTKDGKGSICAECNRKSSRNYRERNLDECNERTARWKKENPKKYLLYKAQRSAQQRGFDFSIAENDFDLPKTCPILGIDLNYDAKKGDKYAASIDRKDSTKGYVPGNVWVISWKANTIKNDATPEELRKVAAATAQSLVTVLPSDADARNKIPMCDGLLDYFPLALAEVSKVSFVGNQQHNPGQPMHWARTKSTDHANKILKHLTDRGTLDTDGMRHSAKVAWRALALLQEELESVGGNPGRASKW